MADTVTVVGIQFQAKGGSNVEKAFKRLGRETGLLKRNFSALSSKELANVKRQLLAVNGATGNSINSMQAQKVALQGLRNMADVTGREFKELTRDIALLDQKMKQASSGGGAGGLKGRLKGLAKGAGAIAAGGIFGGAEGAIGGAIGLKVGGPAGAAVGAAIGAQVGMVRQQISALAEYSAALGLQRKALRLVIGDTGQFNKSQKFLLDTSRKLAIPQDVITRQFTSLTASVVGAGQSVSDAEEVFKAIAAGIRGTGGNLEDMKAAMRATSQVFSKGKVSAEELRQQLGERLPGAFTLFAESMDKTPAELDKALEQGKVTLDDFMKFAKTLFDRYGENAEILAKGPEAAGDRLLTAISELKDNIGSLLLPIGASFQKTFSAIVEDINKAIDAFKKFAGIGTENQRLKLEENFRKSNEKVIKLIRAGKDKQDKEFRRALLQRNTALGKLTDFYELNPSDDGTGDGTGGGGKKDPPELNAIQQGASKYLSTIKSFAEETAEVVNKAFKGMEDALVNFVMTGKLNFSDLAKSIISDMARIFIRQQLLKPFANIFKANADGNAFGANGIVKYRKGGIVNSPTMFAYGGSNLGIMGEAGPEAILPLKRGRGGKLGVIAQGGGGANVTVNVDASNSSVSGDDDSSRELGEALAAAIQNQLVEEQRPGGLLA